ncbi:hypothetical protein GCM10009116_21140 [Brevundimonas basaltis]
MASPSGTVGGTLDASHQLARRQLLASAAAGFRRAEGAETWSRGGRPAPADHPTIPAPDAWPLRPTLGHRGPDPLQTTHPNRPPSRAA